MKRFKPIKIAVYFWGCNKLDRLACEYLILSLNKRQTLFEFEIHTPSGFKKGPRIRGKIDYDNGLIFQDFEDRLSEYENEYKGIIDNEPEMSIEGGNIRDTYSIGIIERKVKGEWYYIEESRAIISIGDWKKKYAPPSAIEFILSTIIGATIDSLDVDDGIPVHLPTRGCLFDFNAKLENARYSVLINHICCDCRERIERIAGEEFIEEFVKIANMDWIGSVDIPGSVAYELKRVFNYDLARTKGLKPSYTERFAQEITVILAGTVVRYLIGIFIIGVLVILGLASVIDIVGLIK